MRTGLSNLAIGKWIPEAFNQIAPKDAGEKPIIAQAITDGDRKLIIDSLLKQCDAKDGVADGMISDPLACDFDPAVLICKEGKTDSCLAPEKVAAIKKAIGGPKTAGGTQVYPGFLYDTGIAASSPIRGILSPGPGIFGPATTAMEVDVEKEALTDAQPLVDSMSVNLTTFSARGGKLIFYHGDSDPWFSPLDTFDYYKDMAAANGGLEAVSKWSQFEEAGERIDLLWLFRSLRVGKIQQWRTRTRCDDGPWIPGRLLAVRRSAQATRLVRTRMQRYAKKHRKVISAETWKATAYFALWTTLPETFSAATVSELYRERWQIELAIKRLKSLLGLGHLPKKDPPSARGCMENFLSACSSSGWVEAANTFSPGAMNSNLRRSRWRETGFMLRELRHAILPPRHLTNIFRDWKTIVAQLAEPRRGRRRYTYS